jgi:hypothetical protein
MEMVGAGRKETYGRRDFWYSVSTTIEESFEIIGVSLFVYFLYEYAWRYCETSRWKLKSARRMLLYLSVPTLAILVRYFLKTVVR